MVFILPDYDDNKARHSIYNIGNNHPVDVMSFVRMLVKSLQEEGVLDGSFILEEHVKRIEAQPGDVDVTYADIKELVDTFGRAPNTDLQEGLRKFASWFSMYN